MKYKNGKELVGKYLNGHACVAVYRIVNGAAQTMWEFIKSCFGKGFWNNPKGWSNTDAWKNQ